MHISLISNFRTFAPVVGHTPPTRVTHLILEHWTLNNEHWTLNIEHWTFNVRCSSVEKTKGVVQISNLAGQITNIGQQTLLFALANMGFIAAGHQRATKLTNAKWWWWQKKTNTNTNTTQRQRQRMANIELLYSPYELYLKPRPRFRVHLLYLSYHRC